MHIDIRERVAPRKRVAITRRAVGKGLVLLTRREYRSRPELNSIGSMLFFIRIGETLVLAQMGEVIRIDSTLLVVIIGEIWVLITSGIGIKRKIRHLQQK